MCRKRTRWKLLASTLLAIAPLSLYAQKIICVDTAFGIFVPKVLISEIDLSTCSDSLVEDEYVMKFSHDVAVQTDEDIYLFGATNGSVDTLLYLSLYVGTVYTHPLASYSNQEVRGLTCDENDFIYEVGKGIVKRNVGCCGTWTDPYCCDNTNYWESTYLGDLPPDMKCLGDITYRKGKFYLSAIGNKLVEVNMKAPSKSQVVYEFPPGILPIHGLTTVQMSCDSVVTYAIGRAWDHSIIYKLDFDNWTLTQVCDMPLLAIEGAGNKTECALPPCDLFVDLDHDNNSFAYWGNYCADIFCLPPVAVADTDVVILSMANTLDSLELILTNTPNGVSEYLETSISPGNLTVLGNGSASLLFINNGAASLADFEAALKSVLYQNGASIPTDGTRQVRVTGWSAGVASIVSTAELPLNNDLLNTTLAVVMPTCYGLQNGSLAVQPTTGTAPFSYQWQTGGTDSLIIGIGVGSYSITVTDAKGCNVRDTFILTEPEPLVASIVNIGYSAICDSSGSLLASASGGTVSYVFNWNNGVTGVGNTNLPAGNYLLTVTDNNGCEATADYSISAGDTVLVPKAAAICEGESYAWNGWSLSADTALCAVFTKANGCDSTLCLSLTVHPVPQPQIAASGTLCNGGAVMLFLDGSFILQQWSTGADVPEIVATLPGIYWVTVTNDFGCTASASAYVSPGIDFEFTAINPTCFGLSDGNIAIQESGSGTAPFAYSIDSINFFQTGEFVNLSAGDYFPTVMDATGCKVVQQTTLSTSPPVVLDAGDDVSIQLGEAITLAATTNIANPVVLWQPSDFLACPTCLSTSAVPHHSIEYIVTATDVNGCLAMDTVTVQVSGGGSIYIPTAFSPNGDNINDLLTIFTDASFSIIKSFRIFDRWGEMVFENRNFLPNEQSQGWDGTFKGKSLLPGVYVLIAEVQRVDGEIEAIEGEVTLVR